VTDHLESQALNLPDGAAVQQHPRIGDHGSLAAELADRAAAYQSAFAAELKPQGVVASIVIGQLAAHAAAMTLAAEAEAASLELAAQNSSAVRDCAGLNARNSNLVAAIASEPVARAVRFHTAHARGFYPGIRALEQVGRLLRSADVPQLFKTEDECAQYLYNWQRRQSWQCLSCGSGKRCWLRSGARFECCCGRQYSVRVDTLFAGSHVSLLAWFQVVLAILVEPHLPIDELAHRVSIVRRATVRAMAKRVTIAIDSPQADQLLAGLPVFAARHLLKPSYLAADSRANVHSANDSFLPGNHMRSQREASRANAADPA
jgi:hypothetical protein